MTGSCPEPGVIAAFCDRTLDAAERLRWEAHFAGCARCQQVLAVMTRLDDELPRPQPAPAQAPAWRFRWSWAWMAPAAAVVVAGFLWTVARPTLVAPGSEPAARPPEAALADRELAAPPPVVSVEADARKDSAAPVQNEVAARRAQAAAAPSAPAAPQARVAANETVAAEEMRAKALAQDRVGAAGVEPDAAGAAARPAEAARVAERAMPSERFEARAQVAEAKRATMQVVPAAAPEPSPLITSPDSAAMWRLGPPGFIDRSTDRGESWQRQDTGVRVAFAAGFSPSAAVCWLVGRQGTVIRTLDGASWQVLASPAPVDLVRVTARDGLSATVTAVDGRTFETADGGRTWRER